MGDGFVTTKIFADKVVVTSSAGNDLAHQFMHGAVESVAASVDNIPTLVATAYVKGVACNPQPSFHWYSSNPAAVAVNKTTGVCTRATKPAEVSSDLLTYSANGAAQDTGQSTYVGGVSTISAVSLYPNGSESGVQGDIRVIVQAASDGVVRRVQNTPAGRSPVSLQFILTGKDHAYNSVYASEPTVTPTPSY